MLLYKVGNVDGVIVANTFFIDRSELIIPTCAVPGGVAPTFFSVNVIESMCLPTSTDDGPTYSACTGLPESRLWPVVAAVCITIPGGCVGGKSLTVTCIVSGVAPA